jgi:hypothetical protein
MAVAFTTLLEAEGGARRFITGSGERSIQMVIAAMSLFTFPMAYHFFSRFPTWRSPGPLWRGVQWLLYALLAVAFLPSWIVNFLGYDVSERTSRVLVAHPSLYLTAVRISARAVFVYIGTCLLLAMAAVAWNYRGLMDAGSRRRIRLVVAGLIAACIPFVAVVILAFRVFALIDEMTYRFWYPVTFVTMLCIPASIATAVWKDQLFDVRVLVRRGLQYLLARAALRTLLALPIALFAFSIFSNPNRTIAQILTRGSGWVNVVLVAAIATALQSRQRLQTSLDRRFFREAYEQEQVLVHLIEEVRQRDALSDIARLVVGRIESVLHPAALHIFYRAEERSERFEGHSSSDSFVAQQLSQQATLLRLVDGKAIHDFPADLEGKLPDSEKRWLDDLGVRLIVPITGTQDRLVGVLLLGERKSDEPYSATDRRLLQGIAAQIGLVYENQHLQQRVRQDADVRRDVVARLEEKSVSLLKECPVCGTCYGSASQRCDKDGAELALTLPVERTLVRAQARHRASRSEAGERDDPRGARRTRRNQDHGLRASKGPRLGHRRDRIGDDRWDGHGNARLHVAGSADRRPRGRARRHLRDRSHARRNDRRRAAVCGAESAGDAGRAAARRVSPARRLARVARTRCDRAAVPRKGPARSLRVSNGAREGSDSGARERRRRAGSWGRVDAGCADRRRNHTLTVEFQRKCEAVPIHWCCFRSQRSWRW